ncbi:MAG TPA: hypothetical protein VES68_00875 [Candidatus Sulfotelmatobacter sp.]|nr:hypothetical protein [Candidatus Sulfotelmatobacter sp.]
MDSDELLRKIGQNLPRQPETDWAGRAIPDRIQIEDTLRRSYEPHQLSRRELRRLERQGKSPERR